LILKSDNYDGHSFNGVQFKYLFGENLINIKNSMFDLSVIEKAYCPKVSYMEGNQQEFRKELSFSEINQFHFPNLLKVEQLSFANCSKIVELNLAKLETVGTGGFGGCSGIEKLNLPNLKIVEKDGFFECSKI
jgi:hypothetical protein